MKTSSREAHITSLAGCVLERRGILQTFGLSRPGKLPLRALT